MEEMEIERLHVKNQLTFGDLNTGDFFECKNPGSVFKKCRRNTKTEENAMRMFDGDLHCFTDVTTVTRLHFKLVEVEIK